jgi:hypothetical protein
MKKYIILALLLASFCFSFAQTTITLPLNNSVFQRNSSNSALVYFSGQPVGLSSWNSSFQMQYRISTLDNTGNTTSTGFWNNISTGVGHTYFFSTTISTGWYRFETRIFNGSIQIGTIIGVKFGVGEVIIIAGQSNAQGYGSITYPTQPIDDCIIVSAQTSSNVCSSTLPVFPVFSKISNTSSISPNGFQPWAYINLGNQIVDKEVGKVIPVLFLNAGNSATSIDNWYQTSNNTSATSPRTLAGNTLACFDGTDVGIGEPYRTFRNTLNYYGSIFGVRGVLWHQGESDTFDQTSSSVYRTKLDGVIDKSRTNFNNNLNWAISKATRLCVNCSGYFGSDIAPPLTRATNIIDGQTFSKGDRLAAWGSQSSDTYSDPKVEVARLVIDKVIDNTFQLLDCLH